METSQINKQYKSVVDDIKGFGYPKALCVRYAASFSIYAYEALKEELSKWK